jgi:type VI secretion system secreted protein VgrG
MDIHSGIIAISVLAVIFAFFTVRGGFGAIRSARNMTFYRLRRQREAGGWRMILFGIFLVVFAIILPLYGEPIAYDYFPPSPTPSPTPTASAVPSITLSPTITVIPTITDTPLITDTATITSTPFLPEAIEALFQSSVTPNPDVVFSPILFSTQMNNSQAINPNTVFSNPVGHMYAVFSYDKMAVGAQWTALWLHEGQLMHYETKPWDCSTCGTGGFGFTDWNPPPSQWAAGIYEVQIFVGEEWVVVGRFIVTGNPPTAVPTMTPSLTRTPTFTPSPSATPTPSRTPIPSPTRTP